MEARRELIEAVRERTKAQDEPKRRRFLPSSWKWPGITGSMRFEF